MRYELSTGPTAEPVTLQEALDHCVVSDNSQFGYVNALITKARLWCENYQERQYLTATWKLYFEAFPEEIEIRKLPVQSITSIQYVDTNGDTQTLATADYQTDFASEDHPARIKPAYGEVWPSTRSDTYQAVIVTFKAGWTSAANVSATIKHAILLLVSHWNEMREPISGSAVNRVPCTVESLLNVKCWGAYG